MDENKRECYHCEDPVTNRQQTVDCDDCGKAIHKRNACMNMACPAKANLDAMIADMFGVDGVHAAVVAYQKSPRPGRDG